MTIGQKFLKLLSNFTFKPITGGYGVTAVPNDKLCLKNDPDLPNINDPTFINYVRILDHLKLDQL